ncbi:hypothetical protein JL475_33535 [Streptomyces sp. M2CJ-2]|uniref:hypothetical protein n=1 Tax=Streptomyces sp. M2CJ-2 TaxID=2803948 RepID=UPI0019288978|nr:hypothetical protein [Streptomyces sp. M2CJ-2]MBL3670796.1 hypothetical protein [Streptomyces sp. M2CJ-2]
MSEQVPPGYYGTRDVARALGISPEGVRKIVQRGRLKRSGGSPRQPWYAAADVAALAAERRTLDAA